MGFTKLDSGIVDSSIWSEPESTRVVWVTFLAKSDSHGFVGASYSGMMRACNVSKEKFDAAILTLESPDDDSRTPDYDGRRIERVEGGWVVLNYKKYREYSHSDHPEAVRKREYRSRDSLGHVPKMTGHSASASASASLSVVAVKEVNRLIPPTLEMVTAYCEERKNGIDPENFIDTYKSRGWMIGKNKMKDWQASIRTWEKNNVSSGRGTKEDRFSRNHRNGNKKCPGNSAGATAKAGEFDEGVVTLDGVRSA
jgi:hypothetical protein